MKSWRLELPSHKALFAKASLFESTALSCPTMVFPSFCKFSLPYSFTSDTSADDAANPSTGRFETDVSLASLVFPSAPHNSEWDAQLDAQLELTNDTLAEAAEAVSFAKVSIR